MDQTLYKSPGFNPEANLRIVLVEPAGALNIGSVARVMKNFGYYHLVLVNPRCDVQGSEARQMAVHAVDVLDRCQQVATLPEALQGCKKVVATTGRSRLPHLALEHPDPALSWLIGDPHHDSIASALVFGPEDRGLSNDELKYAQRFVQIPTNPDYASLNLAQAVAICCYVLSEYCWQQGNSSWAGLIGPLPTGDMDLRLVSPSFTQRSKIEDSEIPANSSASDNTASETTLHPSPPELASFEALEGYYQQLEDLLLAIGYLHPHTAASRMTKFRQLFNRAALSDQEVAMLRGILRQVSWAVGQFHGSTPTNLS